MPLGIFPLMKLFLDKSKTLNSLHPCQTDGISPERLLSRKLSFSSLDIPFPPHTFDGILPDKWFEERSICCNVEMLNSEDGIDPESWLFARYSNLNFTRSPISFGMLPSHVNRKRN